MGGGTGAEGGQSCHGYRRLEGSATARSAVIGRQPSAINFDAGARGVVGKHRFRYWADFALVFGYLALWLLLLLGASVLGGAGSVPAVLLWGFVLPYATYSYLTGLTVYLHHTNERLPWFRSGEEGDRPDQIALTAHVQFPLWYEVLSHNIMDHPVHHLNPKIPLYRLRAAQLRLNEALGDQGIVEPFGIGRLLRTMRRCKLYDFELGGWVDYTGAPTAQAACTGVAIA